MTMTEQHHSIPSFKMPGPDKWQALAAENKDDKDQQEKARKARDELKNVLLASLQMQHLVVLADSGCSRSAGGPSMSDLWNHAVGNEPTKNAKQTAAKVNHDLADKNIEAFLSAEIRRTQVSAALGGQVGCGWGMIHGRSRRAWQLPSALLQEPEGAACPTFLKLCECELVD